MTDIPTVRTTIVAILSRLTGIGPDSISDEKALVEDLHIDSLDIVDLAMSIEEDLDIGIDDDEIRNVQSVGDLIKHVEALAEAKTTS